MKKNKFFAVLSTTVIASMLSTTVFAATGDVWNIKDDKIEFTEAQMVNLKNQKKVSLGSKSYGYEFNGKVYRLDDVNEVYGKNADKDLNEILKIVEETKIPVRDAEEKEEDLKVESISAITKTGVTVAFKEAPEKDLEGVTVKVVNNAGEEVEVRPLDILKGEKEVTFKFAKSLTEDPKGVWTVDGVTHDIDTLKLIEKVGDLAEASPLNELEFYDALAKLGIKNVDATKIQAYADEIKLAKPTTVEAIQKAVDKANEGSVEADEKKAIAVAVFEAKGNLVTLRAALLDNGFKYVNTEWVEDYQTKLNASAFDTKTKDTVTAAEYDKIQADINVVNNTEIGNAKSAVADVKTANEYKALVFDYMVEDAAGVDTKAKALEEADKFIALMELKASDSSVETYRLLAQLLGDDAKLLNENNKKEYFDAKVDYKDTTTGVSKITTATTASDLVTNVVDAGDTVALDNALAAIKGMTANTAAAGEADNGTKVEIVKANLQKLADVTSHKTGDAKFDMAIVKDAKLANYRDALASQTLATAKAVTDIINPINNAVDAEARVKAVNEASTAAEMKVALTDIALEEGNTDYINLSSEAKLEVAEMVLEARPSKGFEEVAESTPGAGDGKTAAEVIDAEITTQLNARQALIDGVNAIDVVGATATFDFTTVDNALTALEYDAYNDLTGLARVNAAQAFYDNIPTVEKKDGTLEQVEYKTLAEIKAAIDVAVAQ